MHKKYTVRLSESEYQPLEEIFKTLSGSSQKVRRAQILLKADIKRANWSDQSIADAYHCRRTMHAICLSQNYSLAHIVQAICDR